MYNARNSLACRRASVIEPCADEVHEGAASPDELTQLTMLRTDCILTFCRLSMLLAGLLHSRHHPLHSRLYAPA